jgi:hypothetical protein
MAGIFRRPYLTLALLLAGCAAGLSSSSALAATGFSSGGGKGSGAKDWSMFIGGGLGRSSDTLGGAAQYTGWGWRFAMGLDYSLSPNVAVRTVASYSTFSLANDANGSTRLETAANSGAAGQAGMLFWGVFSVGGGVQNSTFSTTTIAQNAAGTVRTMNGLLPFGYADLNFSFLPHFGLRFEGRYAVGSVSGVSVATGSFHSDFVFALY